MCGFIGGMVDLEEAGRMIELQEHRGVRTNIESITSQMSFAHRRLPIQGLSKKFDCPFFYENLIVLFAGEIYNYKEFDEECESDVELLAKQWHKRGPECLKVFDGMFAFLIFDYDKQKLYAATDYLAKKPLYYSTDLQCFSTEIKSLYKNNAVNQRVLEHQYKFGYHFTDYGTMFENILKVKEGAILEFDVKASKLTLNSVQDYSRKILSSTSTLAEAVTKSVERRLVSDVPVSILASGGLDSSIIACIAKKVFNRDDITLFHIENQESKYANILADHLGCKIEPIELKQENSLLVPYYNESIQDLGSTHLQYQIGKAVRRAGFNVAIAGDGADELFSGYKKSQLLDTQLTDVLEEIIFYHNPRLDKMMMANTVELRSPFLSHDVYKIAKNIPYLERKNKQVLKNAFKDILPKEIVERSKVALRSNTYKDNPRQARKEMLDPLLQELASRCSL